MFFITHTHTHTLPTYIHTYINTYTYCRIKPSEKIISYDPLADLKKKKG